MNKNIIILILIFIGLILGILIHKQNLQINEDRISNESTLNYLKQTNCTNLANEFADENEKPGLFETGEAFNMYRSTFNTDYQICIIQYSKASFIENNVVASTHEIYDLTNNKRLYRYIDLIGENEGEELLPKEEDEVYFGGLVVSEKKYFGSLINPTLLRYSN